MNLTWVVGRGGLLGRHLSAELSQRGEVWLAPGLMPWGHPTAERLLTSYAERFAAAAGDRRWRLAWVAGAGVTGTTQEELQVELNLFRATLGALPGRGTLFLASSAGGVYAGVGTPPYDERSPVRALAPYGQAKLAAEEAAAAWAARTGGRALVGRIANLYGPGQNLAKAQGLVSQLCRSFLTGQPLSVYVSLDTLRDYLFAPDCARLAADCLDRLDSSAPGDGTVVTKVLASQRAVTIGTVLAELRRVFKQRPRIVIGSDAGARYQARDLSLRSRVWADLDRVPLTPLPVGMAATAQDLRRRLQVGSLRPR